MKRTIAITVVAVIALIIAILQKTPLSFLSPDAADFVWGATAGLWIGTIIAWIAEKVGTRP